MFKSNCSLITGRIPQLRPVLFPSLSSVDLVSFSSVETMETNGHDGPWHATRWKTFHVSIKQMGAFVFMKPTAAEEEV